jgi:hypothetical protein
MARSRKLGYGEGSINDMSANPAADDTLLNATMLRGVRWAARQRC